MKKLKDYSKEELELMGYDDIAYIILEESKKKMKINDLFKKICEVLGLSDDDFVNQIADFFEILTTDKKFILLENGYWDLRTRHSEKVVIEEEEEEEFEEESNENIDENVEETEDDTYYDDDDVDDDADDDLKDLVIMDEEEDGL